MSPVFMGAEPVKIEVGKYADDHIHTFRREENQGLELVRSLSPRSSTRRFCFRRPFPRTCHRIACMVATPTSAPALSTTTSFCLTKGCGPTAFRKASANC